jgi:GntR family transcriptional regulator
MDDSSRKTHYNFYGRKNMQFSAASTEVDATRLLKPLTQTAAEASAVPLYRLVKSALLRLLESGQLRPGQALPNEGNIAQALKVSIGTLRKAVDELVHEHILVRRQGKGTYVAMHSRDRFLFQFFHVEPRLEAWDDPVALEREFPVVDNITFVSGTANDSEAFALRLRVGDAVWRIDNALGLGGQCVLHDRIVLAQTLFKDLTAKRFQERPSTIYNLYQTEYGISVIRAQERARAVAVSADIAHVIGLKAGMPALQVHRVALTFGERPVELRISTINTHSNDYVSLLNKR